ncbi:hypothetical protein M378DRAFT_68042 [Amanita muscaria Koide BX008]|uniref:Pentacotripeptide-repeat region of PRORP domain-containing protein n=1 Tax=Amanita muscaria (strain Koide BX008) TaxID=946122 RepID=A0A0C2TSJ9_AMAMK|nr:hypothetical protein M378DRAFT_68042 [Amanita muscaria Koide BX008]
MVEPLASFALNSLLSAHTCLRQTAIKSSIIASGARSSHPKYDTPDFFSPVPRRERRKEKAAASSDRTCLEQLAMCQEWARCSSRHSGWCPIHCRKLMLEEFFVSRDRPVKRDFTHAPYSMDSRARMNPNRSVFQRRHASYTSESLRTIAPGFGTLGGRSYSPSCLNPSGSISALSSDSREIAERMKQMTSMEHDLFNLDEAWNLCEAAVESNLLAGIPPSDVLTLMEKMVDTIEQQYRDSLNDNALRAWGEHLAETLRVMESFTAFSTVHDRKRLCLLARSLSMLDESDRAVELLHAAQTIASPNKDDYDSARAYEAIVLSFRRNHDVTHTLDFLVHEWNFIEPLLYHMPGQRRIENSAGRLLRHALHRIFASVKDPVELIALGQGQPGTEQEKRGAILTEFFCEMRRPTLALRVYHEMLNQGLYVSADIKYLLVLALARANDFEAANKIYESLFKSKNRATRYHLFLGLQLYARQGDHIRTEKYYNDLVEHGWDGNDVKTMYMYAHAIQGNYQETLALFNRFYPTEANGERLKFPDRFTFSKLIQGLAKHGDLEQINYWLQTMSKAGYQPDVYIYGAILKSLALCDDMSSIAAVLSQMRASGVMPNVVIYNTIMSVLARRGDVDGAEAVYKQVIRERIIPDRQMITTLMNAHVEAGSWKGVIRTFDQFKSASSQHDFGFGTETYNTLLKAYVQIGAPYRLVSRLFDKLKSTLMRPDAYSYSLLIQSACDAGLVNVATNIFREMDQLPRSDKLVTVYCMTIIMGGFIRARNLSKAKAMLDEMIQRGIEPSSVSIGTLLQSFGLYSRTRTREGLVLAEEFIRSLSPKDADWNKPAVNRKSALEHIYGPLLHAYSKERRPEDVERLYQDMLHAGGRPTLGILTLLLDSYRSSSRPESVQRLWPQILQLGLEYAESSALVEESTSSAKSDPHHSRLKDRILCIPLSIYIDAMSAAGLHAQVAEVWQEYAASGFGFDSHNWNHLVVALVRGGAIERSFEIVEKVLLPSWKQWQTSEDRVLKVMFSLQDQENADLDESSDTPSGDPSLAEAERRRRSKGKVSGSTKKLARLNPEIRFALFGDQDDVVQPLRLLQSIAPTWNVWRPHNTVLQLLSMVKARLDSGHLVKPVKPEALGAQWDDSIDPQVTFERQRQAREILERIYQNYPETVQMLRAYDTMSRRLLGNKEYGKRHSWI